MTFKAKSPLFKDPVYSAQDADNEHSKPILFSEDPMLPAQDAEHNIVEIWLGMLRS